MRHLIWYLRSAFCKHEWEREEKFANGAYKDDYRVSTTCNKCGWHRSYWKFL